MSSPPPTVPTGGVPHIGLPDSMDIPRLVYAAPYFNEVPLAELIEPAVVEAVQNALPALVPPYVDGAAQTAVQQLAVLLTGSTMSGPLFLSPLMPTQPSQAATMAYVDAMIATAGIPEVPPVPTGQVWARETGQWVPITPQTGVFLPLAGGTMTGNINMSGNTIQNMAAVPAMPNGAAPAQWVLNQIASVSLYQGTWDADTNVPDLTQLSVRVNGYTWIAITTSVSGVVVGQAIPGLQGKTIFNGDTIIYSTVQGEFTSIHAGGLTLPEADARYVQLAGSQMSGALLLNANASQPLQAVTLQQLQAFVPPGAVGEAPNDGQLYGRNGLTASWAPVLPLAGGIMTGMVTLSGNATQALQPATYGQMNSAISSAVAGYLPLAGGTMTGLMSLSGNASTNLNPVPLQQVNAMLGSYLPLSGGTLTGAVSAPQFIVTPGSNFYLVQVSGSPVLNWAPSWFDSFNPSNNTRFWSAPSGILMSLSNTGGLNVTNGITTVSSSFGVASGQTLAISATGPITATGQVTCANCMPQGGNNTGSVGASGEAWFQVVAQTVTQTSDPRLKKDIAVAPAGALAKVLAIAVKNFRWLEETESAPLHTGWDATDVQASLGNAPAVSVGDDANQTLGINTMEMLAWLWQAFQELAAKVPA